MPVLTYENLHLVVAALEDLCSHLEDDLKDSPRTLTALFSARLLLDQAQAARAITGKWERMWASGYKCCERCGFETPTSALNYSMAKDDRLLCPRCLAWVGEKARLEQAAKAEYSAHPRPSGPRRSPRKKE